MANQTTTGLTLIIKATGYSLKGLRAAWESEAAFRQEAIIAVIATIVAFYLMCNGLNCYYLLAQWY